MSEACQEDTSESVAKKDKRQRRRRLFPKYTLEEALAIPKAVVDFNAGRQYLRLSLAESIGRSPDSSQFRDLITSSSAYGLTEGSYKASHISLTELGKSVVQYRSDQERIQGLIKAMMSIGLYMQIAEHFDQNRIPPSESFRNTLIRDFSVDPDLADECISHFVKDGEFVGVIRKISGVNRVVLASQDSSGRATDWNGEPEEVDASSTDLDEATSSNIVPLHGSQTEFPRNSPEVNQRVFITHGSNQAVVQQLKELLTFGKFTPVVAVEQETLSKPVPDKVMDAMRTCFAGIIHVEGESEFLDSEGKVHYRINENVLIEIGAAMALYRGNFILLVQKGVHLPSNLQGLYRCDYDGQRLEYDATMKLLKAFNEFR